MDWTGPLLLLLKPLVWLIMIGIWLDVTLDLSAAAPEGVFYNRMSALIFIAEVTVMLQEMTAAVLAWLEGQGLPHTGVHFPSRKSPKPSNSAPQKAGLAVPKTIAATTDMDIIEASHNLMACS